MLTNYPVFAFDFAWFLIVKNKSNHTNEEKLEEVKFLQKKKSSKEKKTGEISDKHL
jgi:hypothetical protein